MKRFTGIIFSALLLFSVGRKAMAGWEPVPNEFQNVSVGESIIWRSTTPKLLGGTSTIQGPVTLYKVCIGSAAAVDKSTDSFVSIYDSTGPLGGLQMKVQVSSTVVGAGGSASWRMDKKFAKGMTMVWTSGLQAAQQQGHVSLLYTNRQPVNYRVYSSSFVPVDTTSHTIVAGPAILRSIKILNPGTGSSQTMEVYNSASKSATSASFNQRISLNTKVIGEYFFDAWFPVGLTIGFKNQGTVAADILISYQGAPNPPRTSEFWQVYHSSAAQTTKNVVVGHCVLGGVFNGTINATAQMTVYDSTTPANSTKFIYDGGLNVNEKTPIRLEKGLTYTTRGTSPWTIFYRNIKPGTPALPIPR